MATRTAILAAACAFVVSAGQAQTGGYGGYGMPPQGSYGAPGGYGVPGGQDADLPAAGRMSVRMDQLEQQLQNLTGRVEELSHQNQLLSRRIETLEQAPPSQATPAVPPAPQGDGASNQGYPGPDDDFGNAGPASRQAYPPPGSGMAPDAAQTGSTMGAPPQTLGTLPLSAGGAQLPPHGTPVVVNSPEAQYDQAIALLRTENYPGAQEALKAFLAQHGTSPLAGNAQYWLGETYYVQGQYRGAAEAFLQGFQKYPKNSKASASLLKLGMSLGQLKQTKEACLTFSEIPKRYPDAPQTLRQRADQERKKLNCS